MLLKVTLRKSLLLNLGPPHLLQVMAKYKPMPQLGPMPRLPIASVQCVEASSTMEIKDGDVFVCSYPKSGTTWTQNIVATLLAIDQGQSLQDIKYHISDYTPFFDIDSHWDLSAPHTPGRPAPTLLANWEKALKGRRAWNTHWRWDMVPKEPTGKGKFIYLTRSGMDTVCSFYHHLSNQVGDAGTWDKGFEPFFDEWIGGRLPYGKWSDHIATWLSAEAQADSRVLFVTYEQLKEDLPANVARISKHLELNLSAEQLAELVPHFTFASMRDSKQRFEPISVGWKEGFSFLRKGEVGDGQSLMTPELQQRYTTWIQAEFPDGLPEGVRP